MIKATFYSFLLLLAATSPVRAEILYGLAMTGTPKYDATAAHLDYVNPEVPKGGTFTQSATGTFDNLNPYNLKSANVAQGVSLIFDKLMQRAWDEPFTMYPLIAEKVDVPADRSSITFFLNPKAKFSDGTAITADDVIFTFNTLKEHGRGNTRNVYKLVKSVEKRGDLTVHFALGEGYDRETVMILTLMPVLSKAWWENRDFTASLMEPPVSNGPYKITSIDPGNKITYERDPDYWAKDLFINKGQYNFDKMVFDYFRDDTVAFEAFKAGAFDMRRERDAGKWATAYNFPAAKNGDVKLESIKHERPEQVRALIFNTRRTPFDDIRVRKALSMALDFDWINTNLYHGQHKRITSFYPNSELAAGDWVPPSHKTPEDSRAQLRKADDLLKSAGWVIVNGKRVNQSTKAPMTFELLTGTPNDEKIAVAFVRNLKRLGIEPQIRALDSNAFSSRLIEYDYDMVVHYWQSSLSPGTEQMIYYGCDAAKQKARSNFAGICDPRIDELARAIPTAKTREELVTNVKNLDRALMAGYYMIPLNYAGFDNVAYKKHLKHPDTIPLYGMVLENWWSETP